MPETDRTEDCGPLIKFISDTISRLGNNDLRKNGLTLAQLRYIEFLHDRKGSPVPFKEIESHFHVAQPTVTGVIRRLESKGLVATHSCGGTGNAKTASLTAKGTRLYKTASRSRDETERKILSSLNESEKKRFHGMLVRIARSLEAL